MVALHKKGLFVFCLGKEVFGIVYDDLGWGHSYYDLCDSDSEESKRTLIPF